ncbi:hypothetical protein [Salibaculum halophilum]|uniref:hypothetical protein n=1 Tax=Salibaculum halophilum TaxID=1914408 RepID=UPI00117A2416|nr:hypothetical protein [Salibaculum halophilum]
MAVFVGGNLWHAQDLRQGVFRALARERAPAFPVLDALVNLETRQLTDAATLDPRIILPKIAGAPRVMTNKLQFACAENVMNESKWDEYT